MQKITWLFCLLAIGFSSCSNADPKKMATDLCDCFKSRKKVSTRTRTVVETAAKADDFSAALQAEMAAIKDADEKQRTVEEIQRISEIFQSSKTQTCANEIDRKYRVMKRDSLEIQQKMIDEMANVDGCEVYAAFVKAGLKLQARKGFEGNK